MSDVATHFPFLNEDSAALTPGSFMGGVLEDDLMAAVWRLRRWNFYGEFSITRHSFGTPLTVFTASDPSYILNGENNAFGEETDPFADLDDILTNWRKTRSFSNPVSSTTVGVDIWWGPRGNYDPAGDPANGGTLDSEILFTFTDGDDVYYLGTQEGRVMDGTHTLTEPANIDFVFIDPGGNSGALGLYFDINTGGGDYADSWDGELILKPGDLWWPWVINGDDTWDTGDGSQLRDPRRNDTNGKPLIYSWRAP